MKLSKYFGFEPLCFYKDSVNEVWLVFSKDSEPYHPIFELHWNFFNHEHIYFYNTRITADSAFDKLINKIRSYENK